MPVRILDTPRRYNYYMFYCDAYLTCNAYIIADVGERWKIFFKCFFHIVGHRRDIILYTPGYNATPRSSCAISV